MDFEKSQAMRISEIANTLNFQPLFEAIIDYFGVQGTRRNLMAIYFHSVNALVNDSVGAGIFSDALFTLQNIIEALDQMDEPGEKHLKITAI